MWASNLNKGWLYTFIAVLSLVLSGCSTRIDVDNEAEINNDTVSLSTSSADESENTNPIMTTISNESIEKTISADSGRIDYSQYYSLIDELTDGLKNGFTEEQQMELDVSGCFFRTNTSYEIIGYMKRDIDGNGVDELLFGANSPEGDGPEDAWDSIIYDV